MKTMPRAQRFDRGEIRQVHVFIPFLKTYAALSDGALHVYAAGTLVEAKEASSPLWAD